MAALFGASCGGGGTSDASRQPGTTGSTTPPGATCPAPATVAPRPAPDADPAVQRFTLTLVDRGRSTPAIPHRPARTCRVLPTELRVPAHASGPVPLIVVAHGLDGNPSSLGPLLDAWAAAGYVVVAPTFPTTSKDEHGTSELSESVEQARDMTFVLDEMLDDDGPAAALARGKVDPHEIGAAGMSLGGLGVYGLISNTCCRDKRVRAAVLMAAVRRDFPDEQYEHNDAPVLLVQGDADEGYHNSREGYADLVPPKWFVTLHGSNHSAPFEVPPGPEAPLVYAATTAFWDRYLKGETPAADRLVTIVRDSGGKASLARRLPG